MLFLLINSLKHREEQLFDAYTKGILNEKYLNNKNRAGAHTWHREEQLFHVRHLWHTLKRKILNHNNRVGAEKETENTREKSIWPVQLVLTNDMPPTKQLW